jgi:hypothetical protein
MLRLFAALLLGAAASSPHAPQASSANVQRVLFIGNSLTFANDLPGLVSALSNASAGPRIQCRSVAFPDFSLEDHWNRGAALKAIREGGWSVVVLQQGPSALPESRVLLTQYTKKFDAEIRRVGATTALYMVWPSMERRADFEGVKTSYAAAAREVGGLLFPVGEAWRAAWRRDSHVELYGPDGFHPTPMASYLAALVIYQRLSGRSPVGLPGTVTSTSAGSSPVVIPPARAALLQEAAAEANLAAETKGAATPRREGEVIRSGAY